MLVVVWHTSFNDSKLGNVYVGRERDWVNSFWHPTSFPETVRKSKVNQTAGILTWSRMRLNVFQLPVHKWGQGKTAIGENTC